MRCNNVTQPKCLRTMPPTQRHHPFMPETPLLNHFTSSWTDGIDPQSVRQEGGRQNYSQADFGDTQDWASITHSDDAQLTLN